MRIGYIYLTTNSANKKIYIGKRQKTEFEKSYRGSGTIIKQAMRKYGKDKFHTMVIEWCESKRALCDSEKRWIKHFRDRGYEMYNIAEGGEGGFTIEITGTH